MPIPKNSGGVRVLGVPTVTDRIAQTAVKMGLEPQLDPLFHDDSYGYRPGKSALEAIACHQTPLLGPRLGGGVRHSGAIGVRFILPSRLLNAVEEGGLALYHSDP